MRAARGLSLALLGILIGAPSATAHPVAQGALVVEVSPGMIHLRARVSTEEAFVASAFGGEADGTTETPSKIWESHGHYLLEHLRVLVDGRRLTGRLAAIAPPGSGSEASWIRYDLEYPLAPSSAGGREPAELRLEQDVLNEFEFAPGNRWEATFVVSIERRGRAAIEGLLLTSREPLVYSLRAEGAEPAAVDRRRLGREYVVHGLMHILSGYDHLLFIAALVLASATLWDLIKVVSAFTLAHSITLTLAVLDVFRLPGRIVEPMIAASIVFVALQNVLWPKRSRGAGRMAIAFFFGLFHGLGFAGGLLGAMEGMARPIVWLAIVAFSVGVEIGHQVVILPIFATLRIAGGPDGAVREAASRYGSALISAAGLMYLIAALR